LIALDLPNAPPVKRLVTTTVSQPVRQEFRSPLAGSVVMSPDLPLVPVEIPSAPPIKRTPPAPIRRPRPPAIGLLVLGIALVIGPIAGGLFAKAADGQQMIDQFAPYMESSALSRYGADLETLRRGTSGLDMVYRQQGIAAGRFPLLDDFRLQSTAIMTRASDLLGLVSATEPDYVRVSEIGGFDRMPFLVVLGGIVAIFGGSLLLAGSAGRARTAAVLVLLVSTAFAAYPLVGGLNGGASAGNRMLHSMAPVMTSGEVRKLQSDFVVLVEAVGEMETSFRGVARPGPDGSDVTALVDKWPTVSSDLASLVGVIENNLGNFDALESMNTLTRGIGVPGLLAFPWLLLGTGTLTAGLALAAWPRGRKETL
jgi:hypothetical protein